MVLACIQAQILWRNGASICGNRASRFCWLPIYLAPHFPPMLLQRVCWPPQEHHWGVKGEAEGGVRWSCSVKSTGSWIHAISSAPSLVNHRGNQRDAEKETREFDWAELGWIDQICKWHLPLLAGQPCDLTNWINTLVQHLGYLALKLAVVPWSHLICRCHHIANL